MAVGLFFLVAVGILLLLVIAAVVIIVVVLVGLRRPRRADPDDLPEPPTPLERAQTAAAALTPDEWERFRRWMEERRPTRPASPDEGIIR